MELNTSQDIGSEIISKLQELNDRLNRLLEKRDEKKS